MRAKDSRSPASASVASTAPACVWFSAAEKTCPAVTVGACSTLNDEGYDVGAVVPSVQLLLLAIAARSSVCVPVVVPTYAPLVAVLDAPANPSAVDPRVRPVGRAVVSESSASVYTGSVDVFLKLRA